MTLRDFNNAPFPDDPRALHKEPLGNSAGLQSFHTIQPEDKDSNNMPKIVGAVAVALMIGAAGVALYASSGKHPAPVVAAAMPVAPPAPEPAPAPAAMAPDANMPATPPAAAADNGPAPAEPVKEASPAKTHHRTASAERSQSAESISKGAKASAAPSSAAADRMAADSNQSTVQPQQQQAITAPSPSPSDVATNNTQSGVAVSPNATSASDIPAPVRQQPAPATPAPAQPSGADQSAGQVNP